MSVHIISDVFKHSRSRGTARVVLLALANYADEHGACWPSIGRLARDANVIPRNVNNAITKLVELGEVEIAARGGRSNIYRITLTPDESITPDEIVTPVESDTPVDSDTPVESDTPTPVDSDRAPLSIPTPRTVIEPSSEPSLKKTSQKKGSRIDPDWRPDERDCEYARDKGYDDEQIASLAEGFYDHWLAASGRNAVKLNWSAAWRTWVRNDIKFSGSPQDQRARQSRGDGGSLVAVVREISDAPEVPNNIRRIRY